jgi:hypothetical protein
MPDFKLPLAGDVTQYFRLWTSLFSAVGSQFGLVNINLGSSSDPKVEEEVLDVASYGKQLGRIEDALVVLLTRFRRNGLNATQRKAIHDFERLIEDIAEVKERHGKKLVLRP